MTVPEQWKNKCRHKVNEILSEFGTDHALKAPIPIKSVIASYLCDVEVQSRDDLEFPEGVSAFSQRDPIIGWLIVVNGRECVERQRFSAAHEFAHIVLITNQSNKVYCSRESKSWDEKLCDRFAGDILMPEELVREAYRNDPKPRLDAVAKLFKVSKLVAEIQLKRYGLPFRKVVTV